jgi:SnoaL-like domain
MTRTDLAFWLEAYCRAWMNRDPGAAVELYAENATYQDTPFSPPMRGRHAILNYWNNVARTQEEIRAECQIIALAEGLGFAHWHASFVRLPMRIRLELDGIFVLAFDTQNRCTALREWWHRKELPAAGA